MSASLPDDLVQATALLRAGRLAEARALLVAVLGREPRADQAWFLLSVALEDVQQQRDCLRRAVQLNPGHSAARERLEKLEEAHAAPSTPHSPSLDVRTTEPAVIAESTLREPGSAPAAGPRCAPRLAVYCALWLLLGLGSVAGLAVATVTGLRRAGYFGSRSVAVVVDAPTAITYPTLPPTWTASPTASDSPTPTITPTRTPTPSATLPAPNATMAAEMAEIARQVSDLRGLPIVADNASYLVARNRVEAVLTALLLSPDVRAELEEQKLVLSTLGLVKPSYDLVKYALNSNADNIGGFYLPWTKDMYVIGSTFGGVERFIYAHEYDHALTDAHFDIGDLGVYPTCESDGQRCAAIRALVEGDATLLMEQWWRQYARPQDYRDIRAYEPPRQTVPEEFPPPYIEQDLAFPYDYGSAFVDYIYARGNWAAVNEAYANLPQSTEHILHPEAYLVGELPLDVPLPALSHRLGEAWRLVDDDVLGEWMTLLILGYGAETAAQLDHATAQRAAAGWGGDHYQVYHEAAGGKTLLVARWSWDSQRDAGEFDEALQQYLHARFRGARVDRNDGACWEINDQAACLFTLGSESLWLLAPNQAVLNDVLVDFPDF